MRRALFTFLLCAVPMVPAFAADEPPDLTRQEFANCTWFRSKKDDVPVYRRPDTTSEIEGRLNRGEKTCYIGEEAGFAVLQWDRQAALRGAELPKEERRAFARLVDLWPPHAMTKPVDDKVKDAYRYRQAGGVTEDPLWMFRPFIDLFRSPDPCAADPTVIGCPEYKPPQERSGSESSGR